MAKYTEEEIKNILIQAGIPLKDHPIMIAIAMAESSGNPDAVGDKDLVNAKWGESIGLFQIRSLRKPSDYSGADTLRDKEKLFDPVYNAKAAYEISRQGKNWTAWTTFTSGAYEKYLSQDSRVFSRSTSKRRSNQERTLPGFGKGRSKPLSFESVLEFDESELDLSFVQAIANSVPEVKRIYNQAVLGDWSAAKVSEAIRKTDWFRNTPAEMRSKQAMQAGDPATFQTLIEDTMDSVRQLFIDAGAEQDEKKIRQLAERSVIFDLTEEQLREIVVDSIDFTSSFLKGLAGSTATSVRSVAQSFGRVLPKDSAYFKNTIKDILTGRKTLDDVTIEFRQDAINAFPAYKTRFEAGATLDDVSAPYKTVISDILELPSDSINYSDPLLKRLLQSTDSNGNPRATAIYEATQLAKQDNRWQFTKNAQEEILSALMGSINVLRKV
jgi:hypothetical protein